MTNRLDSIGTCKTGGLHALITTVENAEGLETNQFVSRSLEKIRKRVSLIVEPPLPVHLIRNISADGSAYLRKEIQRLSPWDSLEERLANIEAAVHEAVYGRWDM